MSKRRRNKPLSVKVTRDGVLTIEIGIDTLAFSALRAPFAWEMANAQGEPQDCRPDDVFTVTDQRGFSLEVNAELTEEAEDGSSLLTAILDKACEQAFEQGSQFFVRKDEPWTECTRCSRPVRP